MHRCNRDRERRKGVSDASGYGCGRSVARREFRHLPGAVRVLRGTERLRQVDLIEVDRRAHRAQLRTDRRRWARGKGTAARHRHDVPDARSFSLADCSRERPAPDRGLWARPAERHGQSPKHSPTGRARGPRACLSLRAVRRHATARRAQPSPGCRSTDHLDGRAVRGNRRVHARTVEPRAAAHLGGARPDHHLRNAQHRRGGLPRRPGHSHGHRTGTRVVRGRRAAAPSALDRAHEVAGFRGRPLPSPPVSGGGAMRTRLAVAGGERHSLEGTPGVSRVSPSRRLYELLRNRPGIILSPLSFVLLLVLWEFVCRAELVAPIILPPPTRVWDGLVILFTAPWFPQHVWLTTAETLIGFAVGGVGAILLGIAMVNMPLFKEVVYPYVVAFQVMPKVVLAPIFITWFGLGIESKIVMAIAISFFPVVINTVVGLESVEENAMLLMRSLVASRRQIFWKLAWPTALPSIFAGLKTSLTLALIGALVAEFVTSKDGLGTLIITFSFELKTYLVFAVIVVVSVLGLALYGIMEYLDRKVVFWRHSHFTA